MRNRQNSFCKFINVQMIASGTVFWQDASNSWSGRIESTLRSMS